MQTICGVEQIGRTDGEGGSSGNRSRVPGGGLPAGPLLRRGTARGLGLYQPPEENALPETFREAVAWQAAQFAAVGEALRGAARTVWDGNNR